MGEQSPRDSLAGRILLGFLVAACFLVGFTALFAVCAWVYTLGVPVLLVALGALVVLGATFAGLSRWAARSAHE